MNRIVLFILLVSQTAILFANNILNTEIENGGGTISIPDLNFKAYLISNTAINTNLNTEIEYSEAVSFTGTISVNNLSISDLTGIEAFTKLSSLGCYSNSLTTLNVSANTLLTELNCNNNLLTSLIVTGDTSLTTLNCSNNSLTALTLSTNKSLTTLNCSYNLITSLNIPASPLLATLFCNNNKIVSLDVSACTNLDYMNCSNNKLTGLNTTANTNLTMLECSDNSISALNLSTNTKLTQLNCPSNSLSALDISTNTLLTYLWCSYNSITGLNISTNTLLKFLYCDHNLLTALNVSTNTNLQDLYFSSNSITSLNISANNLIRNLECNNNLLSALDVSSNNNLTYLDCHKNSLTTLNLKNGNNTAITSLNVLINPGLSCVSVDNVTWSETNWNDSFDTGVTFSLDCNPIPEDKTIDNTSFNSGDTTCVGAYQTITVGDVAGNPVNFNLGSSTSLIAGSYISFLPGVHIFEGAYLSASITTDSSFCEEAGALGSPVVAIKPIDKSEVLAPEKTGPIFSQSLKVYPNPNSGRFVVELTGFPDKVDIVLYNSLGSVIYKGMIDEKKKTINLHHVPKGLYFIMTERTPKPLVQKIMIN